MAYALSEKVSPIHITKAYIANYLTFDIQCYRQCNPYGSSYQAVTQLRAVFERSPYGVSLFPTASLRRATTSP